MTNEEKLNEILDEIILTSNKDDIKMIAVIMRNDPKYTLGLLSLVTLLCVKCPGFFSQLSLQYALITSQMIIDEDDSHAY